MSATRVIKHNRYLDLGNGSKKFGNHSANWTCQVCQHESVAGVRRWALSIAYALKNVVCCVPGLRLASVGLP